MGNDDGWCHPFTIIIELLGTEILQTQDHKSTTIPPCQLHLEDVNPDSSKAIRSTKKRDPPLVAVPPTPVVPQVSHHSRAYNSPGTPWHYWCQNEPSSDTLDELDDPTLFPHVTAWLQELDEGPCGINKHNFSQYAKAMEKNMFTQVFQLEALTEQKLLTICDSMVAGTASLVLQYARKDCKKIRKAEARRLQEARLQPRRYT
jgi:hypothetical protein